MTEIKKAADGQQQEAVTIETAKVIQGMSLVFCGALTMLEALHPHVSLAPSAILDLVTGNVSGLEEIAAKRRAEAADMAAETSKTPDTGKEAQLEKDKDSENANAEQGGQAAVTAPEKADKKEPAAKDKPSSGITVDEVAKIVVQKVKANPGINDKIRALVNAHGAQRVTELKPETLEAFLTDLSQL